MAGFGSLYSEMDDNYFDADKEYDPKKVFENFGGGEADSHQRPMRSTISRTANGIPVETRRRRKVNMPY
jgi:hypothetical protein